MTRNQGFHGAGGNNIQGVAEELRTLAGDVRRIATGFRADPETIAIQKDTIARRLSLLARTVERL